MPLTTHSDIPRDFVSGGAKVYKNGRFESEHFNSENLLKKNKVICPVRTFALSANTLL